MKPKTLRVDEATDNLLIWWLEGIQAEVLEDIKGGMPAYIMSELSSMSGRPLRGRLWVPEGISINRLSDDAIKIMGFLGLDKLGGIVFHKEDLRFIENLPGIITDCELNTVDLIRSSPAPYWC